MSSHYTILQRQSWAISTKSMQESTRHCPWPEHVSICPNGSRCHRLHQEMPDMHLCSNLPIETLHPHEIPPGPCVKIGVDFFQDHYGKKKHLIIAYYFSKFPVASAHHFKTINHLRELSAAEGVPTIVMSYNGPPFNGDDFQEVCLWIWLHAHYIITAFSSIQWIHWGYGKKGQKHLQENWWIYKCSS